MTVHRIEVGGVGLHVVDEGEGDAVLLVHGWPDTHAAWRHVVPALVESGHRVVAPDLRGFGDSDAPADDAAYSIPVLVGDLLGIADHLGVDRFRVVGHDWGAALAWTTAILAPDRVERLAAISVGHPAAFAAGGFEQRRRSWYMLVFTSPLAEQAVRHDDWAMLRTFGANPDRDLHVEALDRPGRLHASLALYRANVPPEALLLGEPLVLPPVTCPVLGVWSSADDALSEAQMVGSQAHVTGPWRYERIEGCAHFVPVEAPDRLVPILVDFLTAPEGATTGAR